MAETWIESDRNRVVILADGTPGGTYAGWDSKRIARHASLRDSIRLLHNPAIGINVVPTWNTIASTEDGNEPAAGLLAVADIHPITPGSMAIAEMLLPIVSELLPDYDLYASSSFVSGTALNGANFAGTTGNAISTAGLGSGNIASSRMVVDGDITWAELTINTGSQATVNKNTGTLPAEVIPGTTTLSSVLLVKIHAGLTNCRAIHLRQIKQSGNDIGTNTGQDGLHPGTDIGIITSDEDIIMLFHTPPTLVAGDATSVRWQFVITPVSGQTMTGVISIANAGMIIE